MNSLLGDVLSFLPVDAAALALEDLWTIVLQLGLGVVAWSQGVVLGQLAVAEELVAAEVEGEGEAGVGGRLHGDGDVGEVLEYGFIIWRDHSQQRLIVGIPEDVIPELGDALGGLGVVLQCHLLDILGHVLLAFLLLFIFTWPVNLLALGFVFSSDYLLSLGVDLVVLDLVLQIQKVKLVVVGFFSFNGLELEFLQSLDSVLDNLNKKTLI